MLLLLLRHGEGVSLLTFSTYLLISLTCLIIYSLIPLVLLDYLFVSLTCHLIYLSIVLVCCLFI